MIVDKHEIRIRTIGFGYGESILISIGNKFNLVLDSNKFLYLSDDDELTLLKSFYKKSEPDIDFWILTHYHLDHFQRFSCAYKDNNIKNLLYPSDNLIKDFKNLILNDTYTNSGSFSEAEAEGEFEEIKKIISSLNYEGYSINDGSATIIKDEVIDKNGNFCKLEVKVYAMTIKQSSKLKTKSFTKIIKGESDKSSGHQINSTSYITYIIYGEFQAIFLGDAPLSRIKPFIKKENNFNVDLIKIAHHGSKSSTNKTIIDKFRSHKKEQIAIVTPFNKSQLPNQNILDLYMQKGFKVLNTSDNMLEEKRANEIESKLNNTDDEIKLSEVISNKNGYVDLTYDSKKIISIV